MVALCEMAVVNVYTVECTEMIVLKVESAVVLPGLLIGADLGGNTVDPAAIEVEPELALGFR